MHMCLIWLFTLSKKYDDFEYEVFSYFLQVLHVFLPQLNLYDWSIPIDVVAKKYIFLHFNSYANNNKGAWLACST